MKGIAELFISAVELLEAEGRQLRHWATKLGVAFTLFLVAGLLGAVSTLMLAGAIFLLLKKQIGPEAALIIVGIVVLSRRIFSMESGQNPPLTVEQAKARLREAALRCDPATLIAQHPWMAVAASASAGLAAGQGSWLRSLALKGAMWGLRYVMQGPKRKEERGEG